MMKLSRVAVTLLLLGPIPAVAQAQAGGGGEVEVDAVRGEGGGFSGFFDWVHKLSGPGFISPGTTIYYQLPNFRIRLTGSTSAQTISHDAFDEDSTSVTMSTVQMSFERTLIPSLWLDGGIGAAVHYFSGDGFNGFTHYSVPVSFILRPTGAVRGGGFFLIPTVTLTARIFPKFPADAFAAASGPTRFLVEVNRDGAEIVPELTFGYEIRPSKWIRR